MTEDNAFFLALKSTMLQHRCELQRKRLAILEAVIRRMPVELLPDDLESFLNPTEEQIEQNYKELFKLENKEEYPF